MVVIGGFRSDLSITRMIDGNVGNVSAGVFDLESRVSRKTVVNASSREEYNPQIWTVLLQIHRV